MNNVMPLVILFHQHSDIHQQLIRLTLLQSLEGLQYLKKVWFTPTFVLAPLSEVLLSQGGKGTARPGRSAT